MSIKTIITLVIVGIIALGGCLITGMYFSVNNEEVALRNQAEAQRGKVEACFDNTWKIISQKAQVTDQYKEAFKEIYPQLISGRYDKGDGTLMKWIQESNPSFDVSLYKDLMQSIEVQRTIFEKTQVRMLDIIREHTNLIQQVPGKWFVSNKTPIDYTVISSTKSKMTMETGIDDDIDLFPRK